MIRLPKARIENAAEPNNERLADVYFDKENSRLVATDGIGMVVIPVESEDEDVGGRIPLWAIKVARTVRGMLGLRDRDKVIIESRRGTFDGERPTPGFPSTDRVMSQIEAIEERAVISLDAERLFRLAEALLVDFDHGVTLHIGGPREPILVKPYAKHHSDDGRFGALMPLAPVKNNG
jgi:hypothetical protein